MANELIWLEFYIKVGSTGLVLVLALLVAWYLIFRGRKLRLPPGPFPLPIIGNLLLLLGELPHQALAALSLKYGPLMSLRLGSALTLVVSSADVAKEILKTHDRIFANRPPTAAAQYMMYNSSDIAFTPYGSYWRQLRKLCVLKLLSSRQIESFRWTREEEVSAMIHSITNSDRPVSVTKTASALTDSMFCRMVLCRKYSEQDSSESREIISMVKETIALIGSFNVGDYIPFLHWMDLQGFNRRFKHLHKTRDELLERILEEHISQNSPNLVPDLVDVLLAASADEATGFQITRDHIKAVIYDLLVAGIETTGIGIEWAMSEVLGNPSVLKKLQDELERVVGLDRMVSESDLPSLVYLQAMVKETLRLHSPGPLSIPHFSVEDCTLLGYEIPSGTCVMMNLWAMGRNPKSWGEDAESFKPERFMEAGFLDGNVQNFEWIPFGAGRRGCPGQQLGTLVIEFVVAQLLHCFNWSVPDGTNGRELNMTERFNGLTVSRKHELLAVPTPRLPIL